MKMGVSRSVLMLMLRCLSDLPEHRPTMEEVVKRLNEEYEEMLKGDPNDEMKVLGDGIPTFEEVMSFNKQVGVFMLVDLI